MTQFLHMEYTIELSDAAYRMLTLYAQDNKMTPREVIQDMLEERFNMPMPKRKNGESLADYMKRVIPSELQVKGDDKLFKPFA